MNTQWFTIKQVNSHIYAIAEFNHFEQVVSYLVVGYRQAILIDTGMGYESISTIIRQITRLPVRVLLTHTHWDHIGGVSEFRNVSVFNEKTEIDRLAQGFNSTEISELQDMALFQKPFLPKSYSVFGAKPVAFFDHEVFVCDPWQFEVIHTPGHTHGSVCFLEKSEGWLFTGDTLYPGPLYAFEDESDIDVYTSSIRYINNHIDMFRYVFPGHNAVQSQPSLVTDAVTVFDRIKSGEHPNTVEFGKQIFMGKQVSVLLKDDKRQR